MASAISPAISAVCSRSPRVRSSDTAGSRLAVSMLAVSLRRSTTGSDDPERANTPTSVTSSRSPKSCSIVDPSSSEVVTISSGAAIAQTRGARVRERAVPPSRSLPSRHRLPTIRPYALDRSLSSST
jgi:hypothetical protein